MNEVIDGTPPKSEAAARLGAELAGSEVDLGRFPVVIGFDAFIDESIRIVDERADPHRFEPVPTIADYGRWVSDSAGRSGLREFVAEATVAGGCTVHTGDGLATLGLPVDAYAGIGRSVDAVFDEFVTKCRSVDPVGMEPGRSIVTEFDDGKLMLSSVSHFARFTPDHLARHLDRDRFRSACESAAAVVLTSWSVYPYMTACWQHLVDDILADLVDRPRFFFDLADPASRSLTDIATMVEGLSRFERLGPTTLSLNGAEARRVGEAVGLGSELDDAEELAAGIRAEALVSEVEIHLIDRATTATVAGTWSVAGPFAPRPRRSVGAGDRFNAGFLVGQLLDLDPVDRLTMGAASSGFFVRRGRSPTWEELVDFLLRWGSGRPPDTEPEPGTGP